jgi:hypothetical protein
VVVQATIVDSASYWCIDDSAFGKGPRETNRNDGATDSGVL